MRKKSAFFLLNEKQKKMAKLNPALREKRRYVVFEILGNVECRDAFNSVEEQFGRLFGIFGASKAAVSMLKSKSNKCIVRVDRKHADHLKAAAVMVSEVKGEQVIMRSLGTSGSVKGAVTKYFGG